MALRMSPISSSRVAAMDSGSGSIATTWAMRMSPSKTSHRKYTSSAGAPAQMAPSIPKYSGRELRRAASASRACRSARRWLKK